MGNNVNKLLVIEDDILMVKILEFVLKKEGYEIIIAKDGIEGLEKIKTINPDMIITDIILPFKSGLEIISYTKENQKHIPVIVVSSMGEEEGTVMENSPREFVVVPALPAVTVAPTIGFPLSSVTLPVIVRFCAEAIKNRGSKAIRRIIFFIS